MSIHLFILFCFYHDFFLLGFWTPVIKVVCTVNREIQKFWSRFGLFSYCPDFDLLAGWFLVAGFSFLARKKMVSYPLNCHSNAVWLLGKWMKTIGKLIVSFSFLGFSKTCTWSSIYLLVYIFKISFCSFFFFSEIISMQDVSKAKFCILTKSMRH